MKSPIQRRVAVAALLLAPLLTACGFSEQTDQVYQPAVGTNDRSGTVDILDAVIVTDTNGSGTFAGTLVNKDTSQDDRLDSVSGPGITSSRATVAVPAGGTALLADTGAVTLQGTDIVPGNLVELTFSFGSGQTTTFKVPVVAATADYADVPLPTPSSSPSKRASKSPSSSPSSSPTATATTP
ncbi:MAG: hypothetical protein ACXV2J_04605 [Actinomycetes bacterium]